MLEENLIEIFSSTQGEGKYVGCRQIFLRLTGCNLHCSYCDTKFHKADFCNFETSAGSMKFNKIANPISVDKIIAKIKLMSEEIPTHSISFTGGEPMLHGDFIRAVSEEVNQKIFVETNGTLYHNLEKLIDCVDIISMDIKLPSVVEVNLFESHKRFMEIAIKKDLYTKIVITKETTDDEFMSAIEMISSVSKDILLILQPVTPINHVEPARPERLLSLQAIASKYLNDVRMIPQTHRMINVF